MRTRPTQLLAITLLVGATAASAPAAAQDEIPLGDFNVMRYTPAVGPRNYFMVEGAQTPGHLMGSAGLTIDYAHVPFVLYDASCDEMGENCEVVGERTELVQYTAAAFVHGTFQLFDRLQIGLTIPLILSSGDGFSYLTPEDELFEIRSGDAFALGDPRLSVKGRIYTHAESGFSLAASAFVTAPTAHYMTESRYIGDPLPTFGGHVIAELVNSGVRVAANIGGMWRDETDIFSTHVGPQITYAVAGGYDITPMIGVFAELTGGSSFVGQVDEHNLEWRLGGRLRYEDFDFNLAGGSGLTTGVGTPVFRIVGGFQWAPVYEDADGDGVQDGDDNCPTEPEDLDNWEDEDGCPESDNDDDGRPDSEDPCPDEAEDMDGFEDEDGCPDTDNDGDGIHDGYDSCPDEPEDVDDDRDEDGCPDNDSDRDGIEDADDQCPDEEEDFDGFGDDDGCPEEDFDGDGRPDIADQCPEQAEDIDEFEDEDGCPEEGGTPLAASQPADADSDGDGIPDRLDTCPNEAGTAEHHGCAGETAVTITDDHLEIAGTVYFDTGRATIQERSHDLLRNIARVLNDHTEITRVVIEGHTDSRGNADRNRRLSTQRAQAVVAFLANEGVARSRLSAEGFGSDRPVVENASTDEEHSRNRRVEFRIEH